MRRFSCIGVGWLAGPGQRDVFATHLAGQRTPCRRAADRRWLCSSLGGGGETGQHSMVDWAAIEILGLTLQLLLPRAGTAGHCCGGE